MLINNAIYIYNIKLKYLIKFFYICYRFFSINSNTYFHNLVHIIDNNNLNNKILCKLVISFHRITYHGNISGTSYFLQNFLQK